MESPVKLSKLLLMVTVFIASHAVAQIYRWVDEHGVVHYEDCPPVDCAFEEVELPEGPSAEKIESAKAKMREILEARKARDHAAKLEIERIALEEREKQELVAEQLELCAETIYELDLLSQQRRIYKVLETGTRLYLADADRPGEVSRISALRDEFCSADSIDEQQAIKRAHELSMALSRSCEAARERLERMLQTDANPDAETLKDHQAYVETFCPEIEPNDLWQGDWIVTRKRRQKISY